jgi:Zn-dependent peptidase ImmA (M78 family)/DNA-binding XRE family transcriptional regulator
LLRWAREGVLLSLADAAHRIGVKEKTLTDWETGKGGPTLPQLRNAANVYRQSIATFLLAEPSPEPPSLVAFRTLPQSTTQPPSRAFVLGLRRAVDQQATARYLARIDDALDQTIDLRLNREMKPDFASQLIRSWLGVSMGIQTAWSSEREAFRWWVGAIEAKRILVIHVAGVELSEMRAFAQRSRPFPVIALNGKDTVTGKLFSLVHELAHILLDADDLADEPVHIFRAISAGKTTGDDEAFCNRVSAATLVPERDLLSQPLVAAANAHTEWDDAALRALSDRYRVSREAMLLRLLSLGKTSNDFYQRKRSQFAAELQQRAEREIDRGGGGDYYRQKVRDLGRGFVLSVASAYEHGEISSRDVTRFLDAQLGHVPKLVELARSGG